MLVLLSSKGLPVAKPCDQRACTQRDRAAVTCACDAVVRHALMQVLGPGGAVAYTGPPGGMTPELETLAGFTVEDGGEGDGAAGTTSPTSGSGATTGSSQVATSTVSPSAGDAQVPKDADELVSSLCVVRGRCTAKPGCMQRFASSAPPYASELTGSGCVQRHPSPRAYCPPCVAMPCAGGC